jgi:hypothetical protein
VVLLKNLIERGLVERRVRGVKHKRRMIAVLDELHVKTG